MSVTKELYVIITRSPDMVNEEYPTEKFQKETKGFTDKVFAQSMLGTNGVLVTINFVKSSTRQKIGVNTTYLQGTSIATGNDLAQNEINKVDFQANVQNQAKQLSHQDDYIQALVYQLHQKLGDFLPTFSLNSPTSEKLDLYVVRLLKNEKKYTFRITINGKKMSYPSGAKVYLMREDKKNISLELLNENSK